LILTKKFGETQFSEICERRHDASFSREASGYPSRIVRPFLLMGKGVFQKKLFKVDSKM